MSTNYNIGFTNEIEIKRDIHHDPVHYCVYDICEHSTGKIIAFATSNKSATQIVYSLNGKDEIIKELVDALRPFATDYVRDEEAIISDYQLAVRLVNKHKSK